MNKTLEEIAKERGKQLLIEKIVASVSKENIEVFQKNQLIESEGKQYECRGVLKNVPVTRFVENLNGRIYSKPLWENVKKKGIFEGSSCLADHDDGEGSVKNIAGVWRNFKVNEATGNADIYCVGEYGQLMLEVAQASGKVGFSTVGFGEFLTENEKMVNPDTYEYDRTDWVLNPSQSVFATYENIEESTNSSINIKRNNNKNIISEQEITNKIDNKKEVKNMDKLMETNHRNQVKEAIRQAKKLENIKEGIEILSSIETESEDLKKTLENEISTLQNTLNEQRENALKELEVKTKEFDELSEKYNTAVKVVDEMKAKIEDLNKIREIFEIQEDIETDVLKEQKDKFTEEYNTLCENVKLMKEDLDAVSAIFENDNFKKMEIANIDDVKNLVEDTIKRDEDIEYLYNSLKEAEEAIEERDNKLKELGVEFEEEKKTEQEGDDEEMKKDDKEMKKDGEEKNMSDEEKGKKSEQDDEEMKKDDEKDMEEKKGKKKENSEIKSDMDLFIEREIQRNPSIKDINDELKKCGTLLEAIEKIDAFNSKDDDDKLIKYNESIEVSENTHDDIEPYRFSFRR